MDETTLTRRWGLLAAVVAVAVVAGVGVLVAGRDDDGPGDGPATDAVPPDVLSGPGTELADGLEVAAGSSLLGPVVVTEVGGSDEVTTWFALVLVEDDAIEVWQAYADQLSGLFPEAGIPAGQAPGCAPGDDDLAVAAVCSLEARDTEREVDMDLGSVPGDVTGRYLLQLSGEPSEEDDDDEIPSGLDELPDPQPARERPGVGEPLAPVTAAYEGDDEEYVVVERSELLAQYGAGSLTGGFAVLIRVDAGADLDSVVDAYVAQADQYDDPEVEETPPPDVTEHQGTTVSRYDPPGGAGGYTGDVTVVDRPEGDDYIYFELFND